MRLRGGAQLSSSDTHSCSLHLALEKSYRLSCFMCTSPGHTFNCLGSIIPVA